MRRAIQTHMRDFAAVGVLVLLALATVAYILEHQPAFMFGRSYYQVRAVFATASAVTPGQGQSVTIAGVEVGLVGGVQLEHGQAVVTMDILKKYAPIYRNATVLLRPRTPLKDMYLALDPGTASARGGTCRRHARNRQHRAGRRRRPDPRLARRRYPHLPAAAARPAVRRPSTARVRPQANRVRRHQRRWPLRSNVSPLSTAAP